MKKYFTKLGAIAMSAVMALSFTPVGALAEGSSTEGQVPIFGLYNPNSGEHLFTASASEAQSLQGAGWQEGEAKWYAPTSGEAVYRLYNPNVFAPDGTPLGDHHYTSNLDEVKQLLAAGWKEGNVVFYSSADTTSDRVPIYGVYNPNAYAMGMSGAHHLTFKKAEVDNLLSLGWKEGDPKFYGFPVPVEEVQYDVLADGRYSPNVYDYKGKISADLSLLTLNTSWWHYDTTTWQQIQDYPKKEYHIPIAANCKVTEVWGDTPSSRTTYSLSEYVDKLNSVFERGGMAEMWITVEGGKIVEFMTGG